ncbi:MAG: hypothetical protein AVO39_08270 [delta proteobacterium MLS_D]|jgi:secondary thiamine-phosphate synthase enzyme|nr:MAG: hypothetical protein AVO39_08270 [delta proteobacterium MLS_D]
MHRLSVQTNSPIEMIDITDRVGEIVASSGVEEGLCYIFVPHTTAAVTINENADPDVQADIIQGLESMVPPNAGYRHREGNADAHIKASLIGASQTVLVEEGRPLLGIWQSIFFCEFDGPRRRNVWVTVGRR